VAIELKIIKTPPPGVEILLKLAGRRKNMTKKFRNPRILTESRVEIHTFLVSDGNVIFILHPSPLERLLRGEKAKKVAGMSTPDVLHMIQRAYRKKIKDFRLV